MLDFIGGRRARPAADRLIAVGILAAIPASLAGATDWGDTQTKDRRVGLVHAAANILALALYAASLRDRRRANRIRGRALSLAGAGALGAGGYLGGHLVFARGLGVDCTVFETRPPDWVDIAADADVTEGRPIQVRPAGVEILLARDAGQLHALADRCTHRGAPLHAGPQRNGCIECPWHQSIFRLSDGAVLQGPATTPAPAYETRVRDGRIEVRASRRTPPLTALAPPRATPRAPRDPTPTVAMTFDDGPHPGGRPVSSPSWPTPEPRPPSS